MGSSSHDDEMFTIEVEQIFNNIPNLPAADEPEQNPSNISSYPDTVIVVNTQNMDKEMIMSRRSSYQKILAMEKRGAQVVERDLKFPVDVIISVAMCLVWYDCENIRKKATASDEASSSLPWCIENIAANILTSLSFSFSCCVLVFEGESNFLSAVMESSDELYAAAFSLKMDLQLFFSHSSELTDEIILNCIEFSTKLTKHLYPKMPESETLAESFLTSFLSLNPLSAHAILSSGVTLVEFFEWSHEQRLRAIQKYHVSDESIRLFRALCKYGEREDSRSAMTDCSSSVSSAPESRSYHCKPESVKRVDYRPNLPKIDIPMDDLFNFEILKQFGDDNLNPPEVSKSHKNWILGSDENFGDFGGGIEFQEKQGTRAADVASTMTPLRASKYTDPQMPRSSTSYEVKKSSWPFDGELFDHEEAGLENFNFDFNKILRNPQEDFRGEVIDFRDTFPVVDDFSSIPKSMDLSNFALETDRNTSMGNSRTARRLSFSNSHLPSFPTSAEISSNFNMWDSIDDKGKSSNRLPRERQGELLEEGFNQKKAVYFPSQSSGSALANAVLSAKPQQGSPWTMEFLNRIREKSRLRQQALPPNMSPIFSPFRNNQSKGKKRKSPSILDFYRYQGGNKETPNKINEKKRLKRYSQPPASCKKQKTVPPSLPAWTPLDKRAHRTLSFSTGGGGGQSKLIWSDKDALNMDRRYYHRG